MSDSSHTAPQLLGVSIELATLAQALSVAMQTLSLPALERILVCPYNSDGLRTIRLNTRHSITGGTITELLLQTATDLHCLPYDEATATFSPVHHQTIDISSKGAVHRVFQLPPLLLKLAGKRLCSVSRSLMGATCYALSVEEQHRLLRSLFSDLPLRSPLLSADPPLRIAISIDSTIVNFVVHPAEEAPQSSKASRLFPFLTLPALERPERSACEVHLDQQLRLPILEQHLALAQAVPEIFAAYPAWTLLHPLSPFTTPPQVCLFGSSTYQVAKILQYSDELLVNFTELESNPPPTFELTDQQLFTSRQLSSLVPPLPTRPLGAPFSYLQFRQQLLKQLSILNAGHNPFLC